MIRGKRSLFLHFLLILAFITTGISPACKFISGQTDLQASFIEICTAQGIKMMSVPGDDGQSRPDQSGDHKKSDQCSFCFASAHSKTLGSQPVVIITVAQDASDDVFPALIVLAQGEFQNSSPRGPPVVL
jgi:hypothetical protein